MGQAADPVDGRADLRLAGQVPPPEQGPREERPVVGIVHQAGHDPVDVSPASPLRCGRRIPLSRCSLNRPYGTVTKPGLTYPRLLSSVGCASRFGSFDGTVTTRHGKSCGKPDDQGL